MTLGSRFESVVDKVALQIVNGEISPGEAISLTWLQEEFNISRTVAREVMRTLESVGFVDPQRSVGLVVLPESAWDVTNWRVMKWRLAGKDYFRQLLSLSELRAGIEPVAAAGAARNATTDQREKLLELAAAMEQAAADENQEEFLSHDIAFHSLVLHASGNEIFGALTDVLALTLGGRVQVGMMPQQPVAHAVEEHRLLADAILQADAEAAHRISEEMLENLRAELFPTKSER